MSLLRYAENRIVTHGDGSVTQSIPGEPVLAETWEFMDFVCVKDHPCDRAMAIVRGLYPKQGVPFIPAFLGGFVLPPLLVLGAVAIAANRRWLHILLLWIAALFLSGVMLQMPGKYFSAASKTDLDRQIADNAIYVTKIDAGTSCPGTKPCIKNPYFAFTRGLFPTEGVPRPLAEGLGMVLPGLLVIGSLALALRRRPRSISP